MGRVKDFLHCKSNKKSKRLKKEGREAEHRATVCNVKGNIFTECKREYMEQTEEYRDTDRDGRQAKDMEKMRKFPQRSGLNPVQEPRAVGGSSRRLCAEAERGVSYEELKELKKSSVVHIDVRERWEVDRDGKIPASINIPLKELVEALQMDPTDFRELYNQKMPAKSDHVVFSCFAGSRSKQALNFATSLGFSRVQHFPGGFEEWAKREHPEKK
uniref:Rhodanese domain-containing protein n=1 Tax=Anas platyrhynchos platyrhynchos TaxID=8840 RepID=U3IFV1_ANAPP